MSKPPNIGNPTKGRGQRLSAGSTQSKIQRGSGPIHGRGQTGSGTIRGRGQTGSGTTQGRGQRWSDGSDQLTGQRGSGGTIHGRGQRLSDGSQASFQTTAVPHPETNAPRPSIAASIQHSLQSLMSARPSVDILATPHPLPTNPDAPRAPILPVYKPRPKVKYPPGVKKIQSYQIVEAFSFFCWVLRIFGRFPLKYTMEKDGGFWLSYVFKTPRNYIFVATNYFLTFILTIVMINLMSILLNIPEQTAEGIPGESWDGTGVRGTDQLRAEELYLFHRNVIPVFFFITELIQAVFGGFNFAFRSDYAGTYMTLWSEAVEIIRINTTVGLRRHMIWVVAMHAVLWIILVAISFTGQVPVAASYPSMFTVLLFRMVIPHIHASEHLQILRVFSWFIILFVLMCSKLYILFFHFYCKMLKSAFKVWNTRLDRVLHRGEGANSNAIKKQNRTGYDDLFKDHICLLDLLIGCDELFGTTVMMYYGTQIMAVCFEIYYFVRSQSENDEFRQGIRQFDGWAVALYFAQTMFILYYVTIGAADVGEQASDGLEVIRSKGMLGDKGDEELYFMLSMYVSYSGHPETALTAGKFFVVDKSFIVTLAATIFSYFVILIQFTPAMEYQSVTAQKYLTPRVIESILLNFELTAEQTK